MRNIGSVLASVRLILTSVSSSPFGTTAWGVALSSTFLVYDRIIAGDLLAEIRLGARALMRHLQLGRLHGLTRPGQGATLGE